jgi:hypothetical protein
VVIAYSRKSIGDHFDRVHLHSKFLLEVKTWLKQLHVHRTQEINGALLEPSLNNKWEILSKSLNFFTEAPHMNKDVFYSSFVFLIQQARLELKLTT